MRIGGLMAIAAVVVMGVVPAWADGSADGARWHGASHFSARTQRAIVEQRLARQFANEACAIPAPVVMGYATPYLSTGYGRMEQEIVLDAQISRLGALIRREEAQRAR